MKTKTIILLFLTVLFLSCTSPEDDTSKSNNNPPIMQDVPEQYESNNFSHDSDTIISIQIGGEEIEWEEIEAGVEAVIDITQTIVGVGAEVMEAKRRKDSIKLSRKEKMIAYQLGFPFKNRKLLLEAYLNLSDTENVYSFRKGSREFLLVKYQDKTEEELDKELEDYKIEYGGEVKGEIKKIDLARECGKRKSPRFTNKLRSRKKKIELDCLSCK